METEDRMPIYEHLGWGISIHVEPLRGGMWRWDVRSGEKMQCHWQYADTRGQAIAAAHHWATNMVRDMAKSLGYKLVKEGADD